MSRSWASAARRGGRSDRARAACSRPGRAGCGCGGSARSDRSAAAAAVARAPVTSNMRLAASSPARVVLTFAAAIATAAAPRSGGVNASPRRQASSSAAPAASASARGRAQPDARARRRCAARRDRRSPARRPRPTTAASGRACSRAPPRSAPSAEAQEHVGEHELRDAGPQRRERAAERARAAQDLVVGDRQRSRTRRCRCRSGAGPCCPSRRGSRMPARSVGHRGDHQPAIGVAAPRRSSGRSRWRRSRSSWSRRRASRLVVVLSVALMVVRVIERVERVSPEPVVARRALVGGAPLPLVAEQAHGRDQQVMEAEQVRQRAVDRGDPPHGPHRRAQSAPAPPNARGTDSPSRPLSRRSARSRRAVPPARSRSIAVAASAATIRSSAAVASTTRTSRWRSSAGAHVAAPSTPRARRDQWSPVRVTREHCVRPRLAAEQRRPRTFMRAVPLSAAIGRASPRCHGAVQISSATAPCAGPGRGCCWSSSAPRSATAGTSRPDPAARELLGVPAMELFWFIPTHGDGRFLGTARGARPVSHAYCAQIARAADELGYDGVLLPTGRSCEDAWIVACDAGAADPAPPVPGRDPPGHRVTDRVGARMTATLDRHVRRAACSSTSSPAAIPPRRRATASS